MADLLPAIDIKISVEPSLVLERMIDLSEQSGRFTIEHIDGRSGGTRLKVVNFRLLQGSQHEGHGFQLIVRDEKPGRIQVEMRAQRWSPDPPTRAVCEQSARDLVQPLLKRYNRSFQTRHRLRIVDREMKPFRISERTQTLLDRFTILANTSALHSLDWRRLYVLVCEGRQQIPRHVLRSEFERSGFTPEKASELAELYHHLWVYKQLF